MAKILIAGCGKIGIKLGLKLAEENHDVFGARRNISEIPAPIIPLTVDFSIPDTLPAIPGAIEFVYIILTPEKFDDDSYKRSYVEATQNILKYFEKKKEKPLHIFFISSTSVYGQKNGEWVDENSETVPLGFSGTRMLEAEQLITQSSIAGASCIRFGGIYSSKRTRQIDRIQKGISKNYHDLINYKNLINEEDAVGILHHLLAEPNKETHYLAVDNEPVQECDLLEWLLTELKLSTAHECSDQSLSRKRNLTNKRCNNQRIRRSGYKFSFPTYKEGYRSIIEKLAASA